MAPDTNKRQDRRSGKQDKILVIDDYSEHWLLIESAINQCLPGTVPVHATTPAGTLALLAEWSAQPGELPKLILQDLYLPNREEGWQLLDQLKETSPLYSQIPVVIVSVSDNRADIKEAYQRGAASYLVKPSRFEDWLTYFNQLRIYWWETVTLPVS